MMKERIVTREIADNIYKSYEALRLDRVKPKEALKIIQSDILDEFGVKVGLGTVKSYTRQTFDKFKESLRKYYQSEKGRETRRKYYILLHNPDISSILDVFTDDDVEYTVKEIWEMVGGPIAHVYRSLNAYAKVGVLIVIKGRPKRFKRNPKSPYSVLCDGKFEEAERELFRKK